MKTKTKTKTKILKVLAICILFLGQSHLMAQTSNAPTQTVCVGVTEPYTLVDPLTGPPTANYSYQWSITGGGTFVGGISTGISIDINWTTVGVHTVTVVATDNITNCQDSPIDVVVTVEDLASPPVAPSPGPICLNTPNPTMTATTGGGTGNSVFNWYADNAGSPGVLLVASSSTYTDPILYPNPGTYNYWVTEESANLCEGLATLVTITVTPLPSAPTLSSVYEACFGLPNPQFIASGSGGSNFNWYDNLGNPLGNNIATYTSTEVNPNTYTYFVEEVVGLCTSPQTSFTLTIHPPPAAPSINPVQITICEGETPQDFVATTNNSSAGTFSWYDVDPVANPGAVSIGTGSPFPPIQTVSGTYTYWLTETDLTTTCVSTITTAAFIINELPLVPTVSSSSSFTICLNEPNPTFTATQGGGSTGTSDFDWYDVDPVVNPGATPINAASSNTFTPTQTAVSITNYWVVETNSVTGCEGLPVLFTFEIISLPAVPTISVNPVEICYGNSNPALTPTGSASGTNLIWYDDITLTNQVGTGASFTPPASASGSPVPPATTYSYWVVDQPGTCVSPSLQIDLQINPLPTPGPIYHN